MKSNQNRFIFLLTVMILLGSCGSSGRFSPEIDELEETDSKGHTSLYFYPSTIRMLFQVFSDQDEEISSGSDLREARLFFAQNRSVVGLKSQAEKKLMNLQNQDFEVLMSLNSSTNRGIILLKEDSDDHYVISLGNDSIYFLLEIRGKLSSDALKAVMRLDPSSVSDFLDLSSPVESKAKSEVQNSSDE